MLFKEAASMVVRCCISRPERIGAWMSQYERTVRLRVSRLAELYEEHLVDNVLRTPSVLM